MSTAVAPAWTCPQCKRRVPGREPRCHCGFERTNDPVAPSLSAPAVFLEGAARRRAVLFAVLVAALVVCVVGVLLYAAVRHDEHRPAAAARTETGLARGEAIYPALPAMPAEKARSARGAARTAVASASHVARMPARPLTSTELDWGRAVALLDLPLRSIAADTSVLELSYRRFAGACLASPGGTSSASGAAADRDWLAFLKTARLVPGVTLRDKGATVDCETARTSLIRRADALKSDLDATEHLARTNGVLPDHWRKLMALHLLDVWDRY